DSAALPGPAVLCEFPRPLGLLTTRRVSEYVRRVDLAYASGCMPDQHPSLRTANDPSTLAVPRRKLQPGRQPRTAMLRSGTWTSYKEKLRQLSDRLVEAQRP